MNQPIANKSAPSTNLSVAWSPFTQALTTALGKLQEDQYLILSLKHSHKFVQFAAQGAFGMRAEVVSNGYLPEPEKLNEQQLGNLIDAGWHTPSGSHTEATQAGDPDGSPNYYFDFSAPVSFEAVANLTVRTLTEIFQVPHPGRLQQYAFDDADGAEIELPELGLKVANRTPQGDVSFLLRETLRKATSIADLEYDADADLCVRWGSALMIVRLIENPLYVRIYSLILREVRESSDLFARLNNLNINETQMRFFYREGAVYGCSDISAVPLISAHVTQAFEHFCVVADNIGTLLQAEFGGRTGFPALLQSTAKH